MNKFDLNKYLAGGEVFCDRCGTKINMEQVRQTREIAKDVEGFGVIEQFFECENCGMHYTVLVIDRKMKEMIKKRQRIHKQIALHKQIKSREATLRKLIRQDEQIKQQQMQRMSKLKKRYRKEIEGE